MALSFAGYLMAAEPAFQKSLCVVAKANDPNGIEVSFFQHVFDNGMHDLAMAISNVSSTQDIKRVTFGGPTTPQCHYQAISLARGGDWGWHLIWVAESSTVLSYARMDGAAWVSSPVKKLSKTAYPSGRPAILTFEKKVWVVWRELDGSLSKVYVAYSDDEGRSWQDARLVSQASDAEGHFHLGVKEGKLLLLSGEQSAVVAPLLE